MLLAPGESCYGCDVTQTREHAPLLASMAQAKWLAWYSQFHSNSIGVQEAAVLAAALTLGAATEPARALPASKGALPEAGSYLPAAGVEDFVQFVAPKAHTPVRACLPACSCEVMSHSTPMLSTSLVQAGHPRREH